MGLYLKQLFAGRDFAKADRVAAGMANLVYLIGDTQTRECVMVDPAWDVEGLLDVLDREEMKLVGALATHYHPDHVGGTFMGFSIEGITRLMELRPVPVHVNSHEAEWVKEVTGISNSDLRQHEGGDHIQIGNVEVKFIHTPGHTPGSQCFLVDDNLVSGDTLFIGGCGRVDLPGSDPEQMYYSLTQVLAKLPDQTVLYPGHDYAPSATTSTIGDEKRSNFYLKMKSLDDWLSLMGRG
jgi:glyoxylase-like metal-dependent hydrolase (beta-lactamase superfamily II)